MDRQAVIDSRKQLSYDSIWPSARQLDIDGWLSNFDEGRDQEIAVAVLLSHVHLNEEQIEYSVASAIRSLSADVSFGHSAERPRAWRQFLQTALFSYPESRANDITASGQIFMRIVKSFGVPEERILAPHVLLKTLIEKGPCNVIFLDDLSGSGNQFVQHWSRKYPLPIGKRSLSEILKEGKISSAYFLPVIATEDSKARIEASCGIEVRPAYLVGKEYYALDPSSRIARDIARPELNAFLERYSPKVENGKYGTTGYSGLGLALSFHHGCPNNSLPILRWTPSTTDWKPLVTK